MKINLLFLISSLFSMKLLSSIDYPPELSACTCSERITLDSNISFTGDSLFIEFDLIPRTTYPDGEFYHLVLSEETLFEQQNTSASLSLRFGPRFINATYHEVELILNTQDDDSLVFTEHKITSPLKKPLDPSLLHTFQLWINHRGFVSIIVDLKPYVANKHLYESDTFIPPLVPKQEKTEKTEESQVEENASIHLPLFGDLTKLHTLSLQTGGETSAVFLRHILVGERTKRDFSIKIIATAWFWVAAWRLFCWEIGMILSWINAGKVQFVFGTLVGALLIKILPCLICKAKNCCDCAKKMIKGKKESKKEGEKNEAAEATLKEQVEEQEEIEIQPLPIPVQAAKEENIARRSIAREHY